MSEAPSETASTATSVAASEDGRDSSLSLMEQVELQEEVKEYRALILQLQDELEEEQLQKMMLAAKLDDVMREKEEAEATAEQMKTDDFELTEKLAVTTARLEELEEENAALKKKLEAQ